MKNLRVSKIEKELPYNIQEIWNVVTNNNDYTWRRGIEKIEQISENTFIEYGENYQIKFEVVTFNEPILYEFNMKSNIYNGVWRGDFIGISGEKTKMVFTEKIYFNNIFLKLLSYLMLNLERIQEEYFEDLENKLMKPRS